MFITAVCVLFLIKLCWPKNKSHACLIFKSVFMISGEVPLFTIHNSFIHITCYITTRQEINSSVELLDDLRFILCKESGAPNEYLVKKRLNKAFLNVF